MSRIGKMPVKVHAGVKVNIQDRRVHVEGPQGKLSFQFARGVSIQYQEGFLTVHCDSKSLKNASALQGLTRTLLYNMVEGVHVGFKKELDVVGRGYRASVKGSVLNLKLGYSHDINYQLPVGVRAQVQDETHIVVSAADKVLLGQVAAEIRSFRKPEPYQGKGIKYTHERIVRKQGKSAGAK